jgi:peroxiredoxin Q/BCP
MLQENYQAPNFNFEVIFEDKVEKASLENFLGKKIVLYFYPKDDTPGCTIESIEFTNLLSEFNKYNVVIFGISRDLIKSHTKFIKKHCLKVPLISDATEEIVKLYDVIKLKKMYGKEYFGIERTTFLIDENMKIKKIWRNVKAEGHAEEVLKEIVC